MNKQKSARLVKSNRAFEGMKVQSDEIREYMSYLREKALEKPQFLCGGCISNKTNMKPSFVRAYKNFNDQQKLKFYEKNVDILKEVIENKQQIEKESQPIDSTFNVFNQSEGEWQLKNVEINTEKKIIKFKVSKQELDLHNYILRKSKKKDKQKEIIALQSTEHLQTPETIRLSSGPNQQSPEFIQMIENLIDESIKQNFKKLLNFSQRKMIKLSKKQSKEPTPTKYLKPQISLVEVMMPEMQQNNAENMHKRPNQEDSITFPLKSILKNKNQEKNKKNSSDGTNNKRKFYDLLSTNQNLSKLRDQVYIQLQQNRLRKHYKFDCQQFDITFQWIIDNMMIHSSFTRYKKSLKNSKMLNFNNKSNNKIFYEYHNFKDGKMCDYIYRRENQTINNKLMYFVDTPVSNDTYDKTNGYLEYAVWKVEKISNQIHITVQAKIFHDKQKLGYKSLQYTQQFLGQMDYICSNFNMTFLNQTDINIHTVLFNQEYLSQIDRFSQINSQDEFYSIEDNEVKSQQNIFVSMTHPIKDLEGFQDCQQGVINPEAFKKKKDYNYLNYPHQMSPAQKLVNNPKLRLPQTPGGHPYFENEFKFNENGQMIAINEQKIKAQAAVLKDVLKTIGRNLFSGKSILNLSLPVKIFSQESNLSQLAKEYVYAPILLQKAANQTNLVQRMKYVSAFAISLTNASIQMSKPFNPILGQTFQCFIDGCPVFGEQVSHHPPISSLYIKGRGYNCYGSYEAKLNLGLNSATGSNEGIIHIQFLNGNKKQLFKIWRCEGQVSGLTFGQRKIAAVKSTFVVDLENRIYVELVYGKHKGKTEYCKFIDGVQGKIVELSMEADISKINKINKKYISKEHGIISGRWREEVYYDNELLINFYKDFPHIPENHPYPLLSNCYYRKDLILRVQKKWEEAQTVKEELEQLQRNDKKLRKKFTGKDH